MLFFIQSLYVIGTGLFNSVNLQLLTDATTKLFVFVHNT
jgi:hypothetical protein